MVVLGVALGVLFYRNLEADKPVAVAAPSPMTSQPGSAVQPSVEVPYIAQQGLTDVLSVSKGP